MTKWICQIDGREYESEEEARDAVYDYIITEDFELLIGYGEVATLNDIIEELRRLNSPLYYKLLEKAYERVFQDCFYEIADDED